MYVPKARAEEFFAAVPGEKRVQYYDAGHGLNEQAGRDRAVWMAACLGLRQ